MAQILVSDASTRLGIATTATSVEGESLIGGLLTDGSQTRGNIVRLSSRDSHPLAADQREAWCRAFYSVQEWQGTSPQIGEALAARRYVAAFAKTRVLENVEYAASLQQWFDEALADKAVKLVVATPGRSLEASVAYECSRNIGVPTLDIQAGTISPTRRYRRPTADWCTVIDRVFWGMYRDHFNVSEGRLRVVGAPQIDRRLASLRVLEPNQARQALCNALDLPETELFLLATQPVEAELMERIVRLVLEAVPDHMAVLIKPHRVESVQQVRMYEELASVYSSKQILIEREINIYDALAGASAVGTYYSTVGLEAFALRRPVFVIDPFDVPPALDLASMGMAKRARSREELAYFLGSGRSIENEVAPQFHSDPYLAVLQDGLSGTRINTIIRHLVASGRPP